MKSKDYDWCLLAWKRKWTDEAKLQVWVDADKITQAEYEEIISTPR
ncbi:MULTISPECIES: XkdX family protein [unclassified Paenibacillus]|nr:XkdX family protein [Paenibacillus sp. 32O-W]